MNKNKNAGRDAAASTTRPRRVTTGGATTCLHCKKLCSYGHTCPGCGQVFHNLCMLSMLEGTKKICIACFEEQGLPTGDLDSHDHAPYSPTCKVPYDPFTKRYAAQRKLLMTSESPQKKTEVSYYFYMFAPALKFINTHIGFRFKLVWRRGTAE